MIIPTPLTIIGTIALIPCLSVHDTKLSLRLAVFEQEVRGDELAELELCDVLRGVLRVVNVLGVTSCGAESSIISARCEELEAHVGVTVDAVRRSVDRDVLQDCWSRVAGNLLDGSRCVAIASGVDDLEGRAGVVAI